MSNFTIYVHECTFTMEDEDGNDVCDENGDTIIYDAPDLDFSPIAEYPDVDDLVPIKNEA